MNLRRGCKLPRAIEPCLPGCNGRQESASWVRYWRGHFFRRALTLPGYLQSDVEWRMTNPKTSALRWVLGGEAGAVPSQCLHHPNDLPIGLRLEGRIRTRPHEARREPRFPGPRGGGRADSADFNRNPLQAPSSTSWSIESVFCFCADFCGAAGNCRTVANCPSTKRVSRTIWPSGNSSAS
jgi:hypothetical protein